MIAHELLGPRAWGEPCGHAQLKATASDFQVEEILNISLSGEGEHLWLWVEKSALNTEEAARILAKACAVPLKMVSYAGLKDRHALTRQWFSVHLPGRTVRLDNKITPQLYVLDEQRHSRKLQRGAHEANNFQIRLTALQADRECLEQRLQQIAMCGVPNYFGMQRFGFQADNLHQALYHAQQAVLPQRRNQRSRLLSAARSAIFNRILARRVEQGIWQQPVMGDVLSFTDSRSFFSASEQDLTDPRLAKLDLHPTAALWGAGELPSAGMIRELESASVHEAPWHHLSLWLEQAHLKQERRITRLPVQDLEWHYLGTQSLELGFRLPVGCFATVVIRELVELLPVNEVNLACEF